MLVVGGGIVSPNVCRCLVSVNVTTFENKVFAAVTKLKLYLIRMGLQSNMSDEYPSMKRGNLGNDPQGERPYEDRNKGCNHVLPS